MIESAFPLLQKVHLAFVRQGVHSRGIIVINTWKVVRPLLREDATASRRSPQSMYTVQAIFCRWTHQQNEELEARVSFRTKDLKHGCKKFMVQQGIRSLKLVLKPHVLLTERPIPHCKESVLQTLPHFCIQNETWARQVNGFFLLSRNYPLRAARYIDSSDYLTHPNLKVLT